MDIKARFKAIADYYGLSIRQLEVKAGLSNGYINSIKNSISDAKLEQISNVFVEINPIWLKMGVGEMLQDGAPEKPVKQNAALIGEIKIEGNDSPYIDLGNGQFLMVVPLIPIAASAGYRENYQDFNYVDSHYDKHYFPVTRQYKGRYFAFIVEGDSMDDGTSDAIVEGSTVTGRDIQRIHWQSKFHLHSYKDYIIVHRDAIFVKRITKHDVKHGIITCHSLNPDKEKHADFDLHLDECLQILNIVNVTKSR